MNSQIAQTSNGPIEYTLLGNGPVVLVCHGTSSNCFSTDSNKPLLEAGFSVLTPSRPGYGRTPLNAGRTSKAAAEALAALLASLKIQTCSVIAISGGGPTGVALAAGFPQQIERLALAEAVTCHEDRPNEPGYRSQVSFYGPLHGMFWGMLGLASNLWPRNTARQTLAIFSTHDPDDAMRRLSADDVEKLRRFFQGRSSRQGALNDLTHTVGRDLLQAVHQPTLVIHSREDKAVPFSHAEWSLKYIPHATLCVSGFTGHFYWIGPDNVGVSQRLIAFLRADVGQTQGASLGMSLVHE